MGSNKPIRVGALISGGGTNLQAVIDACEQNAIDAKVVFVGSDMPDAYGLHRAANHHIPSFVTDYRPIIRRYRTSPEEIQPPGDFDLEALRSKNRLYHGGTDTEAVTAFLTTRAVAEAALIEAMSPYSFDLLILAGFMRTLSPYFIDRVNTDPESPRIMNIHPAILPSFPGVDGYGDTYRYGCKVGGCTVHFVDYGEDTGPIIGQKAFAIDPDDTLEQIKKKGLEQEWALYPECIQLFAEKRLRAVTRTFDLGNGKTVSRRVVDIR